MPKPWGGLPIDPRIRPAYFSAAMRTWIRMETARLATALKRLDRQTATVLVAVGALVILQDAIGSQRFFYAHVAHIFPAEYADLIAWVWRFVVQGITGFAIPVAILCGLFRQSAREAGLGRGDWKFGGMAMALYLPAVAAGTWILSASPAFQAQYPHYAPAATDWTIFLIYQACFLFYWIGWEYLWRGFMLFGTAPTLGPYAILMQAIPFALLHLNKPLPETVLSLAGGIALGALAWRCRAFWVAVPIHAAQMMAIDFWCALRVRSGAVGAGLGALGDALRSLGG